MVKSKKSKKGKSSSSSSGGGGGASKNNNHNNNAMTINNNNDPNSGNSSASPPSGITTAAASSNTTTYNNNANVHHHSHVHHHHHPYGSNNENLDNLDWLRECELRRDHITGESYLQLEYQDDDILIQLLNTFLSKSVASSAIIRDIYQIWQQTVLSTLLASSALWGKKEHVTSHDQRHMKDHLKLSRYKINFIMHHTVGNMLCSTLSKWIERRDDLLRLCHQTVSLLPRLMESCPHHTTDIRQTIIHFECKEFLASTACETWDTLYDFSIPINVHININEDDNTSSTTTTSATTPSNNSSSNHRTTTTTSNQQQQNQKQQQHHHDNNSSNDATTTESTTFIDTFIPTLRKCAMLDILDKDWNMLGGWDDILKGLEAKCCPVTNNSNNANNNSTSKNSNTGANNNTSTSDNASNPPSAIAIQPNTNNNNLASLVPSPNPTMIIRRLPSDMILHDNTTILRNARNSMQCKFFSVRFMRYTEDQAPQRWKYFPKCSAPACSNIETIDMPHKYRCTKCWYFHFCSLSCQDYCDNIMGLHPKFCMDTPYNKAIQCQRETEQYLGWHNVHHNNLNNGTNNANNNSKSNKNNSTNNVILRINCNACGAVEEVTQEQLLLLQNHQTNNNSKGGKNNSTCIPATTTTTTTSSSGIRSLPTMKRCQQCQRVFYCSRQCQEWDWKVGGHRHYCRPRTIATADLKTLVDGGSNSNSSNNNNTTTTTTTADHAGGRSSSSSNNTNKSTSSTMTASSSTTSTSTTTSSSSTTTTLAQQQQQKSNTNAGAATASGGAKSTTTSSSSQKQLVDTANATSSSSSSSASKTTAASTTPTSTPSKKSNAKTSSVKGSPASNNNNNNNGTGTTTSSSSSSSPIHHHHQIHHHHPRVVDLN